MCNIKTLSFCVLLIARISIVESTFTKGFQTFLRRNYGRAAAQQLTRPDLGEDGSFGGGPSSLHLSLRHDPVALIHGLNTDAGAEVNISSFFVKSGYKQGSVFATTYGPNGTVISGADTLDCAYLKQIRQFIQAIRKYTFRKVVVIGYSLGSPVSRKAILGGKCLDTGENLGQPLTNIVSAYISVAGANHGAILCQQLPTAPMCSSVNGFANNSQLLQDINGRQGYEGQSRFMIGSTTDEVVGFENEKLPASQANVTLTGFNHVDQCFNTLHIQHSLASTGYVSQSTIDIDVEAESELTNSNCSGSVSQYRNRPGHGSPYRGSGSRGQYDSRSRSYTFGDGYIYWLHKKLTSQMFGARTKIF